jgi:hypothetical protein
VKRSFDLKEREQMFDFVFQLYNLFSLVEKEKYNLGNSAARGVRLSHDVKDRNLPRFRTVRGKRKTRDSDDAGAGSSKRSKNADEPIDNPDLSVLERAGYNVKPAPEGWSPLLPVRTPFP